MDYWKVGTSSTKFGVHLYGAGRNVRFAHTVLNVIVALLPSGYLGKLLIMIIICIVIIRYERTSKDEWIAVIHKINSQSAGFEPARAEPNRFLVYRLNHSATTANVNLSLITCFIRVGVNKIKNLCHVHSSAVLTNKESCSITLLAFVYFSHYNIRCARNTIVFFVFDIFRGDKFSLKNTYVTCITRRSRSLDALTTILTISISVISWTREIMYKNRL